MVSISCALDLYRTVPPKSGPPLATGRDAFPPFNRVQLFSTQTAASLMQTAHTIPTKTKSLSKPSTRARLCNCACKKLHYIWDNFRQNSAIVDNIVLCYTKFLKEGRSSESRSSFSAALSSPYRNHRTEAFLMQNAFAPRPVMSMAVSGGSKNGLFHSFHSNHATRKA